MWWVTLAFELIKLLPKVIEWLKQHPFASKKEAVYEFKDLVKEAIKQPYRETMVGNIPQTKRD